MVSNQKPTKNLRKDGKANTKTDDSKDLETKITTVLNACKDIIRCNNNFMNKQNTDKTKTIKPEKPVKKNASEITLEKVTQDMTNILKDLKDHLPTFKSKNDSFSDVVPKLEESFLKSNQKSDNQAGFFKNCRTKPTSGAKPQNCANNGRPKSGKNNKNYNTKPVSAPPPRTANNVRPRSASSNKIETTSSSRSSSRQSNISNLKTLNRTIPARNDYNPLGVIKAEVQKAMKDKKTFTVKGAFPAIRRALLNRGWAEKLHISYRDRVNEDLRKFQTYTIQELVELLRNKEIAETCRKLIKSKLLANHQVDFYWSYNYDPFKECSDKVKFTKINKFRRDLFSYTNKLGLCDANKKAVWFKIPGVANLNHPRTYSLSKNGDTPDFIRDFNRTAAMSLLKWVVKNSVTGEYKVLSPSGKIPIEVFDFAINECYKFIKKAQHEDIDNEIKEALEFEWNEFLEYFYKTVHIGNHFKKNSEVTEIDMVRKANFILTKLNAFWPYIDMDGMMNIWILKPTDGSRGVGIHMCRTLQYILKTIKANPNRRYIIQKYIERPLLIYNTKFDIRQWFLISSTVPLMIWMYKQCYLRFSSQTYNLRKLHESIHLTNNSVQSRYRQNNRDIALPSYDMWDSAQFKNYLSDIGYPNAFETVIYPGMKQCIIAAVIMYQDKLDRRKNCFELYGADFMLTEDFKPWLIEINSNPALHASTPITARMCPTVLEDVIKVVVDYDANKSANTGGFELVYQKELPLNIKVPDIQIQGKPVTTDYFYTPPTKDVKTIEAERTVTKNLPNMQGPDAIDYVKHIGTGMRKTLEDLLEILKKEKQKRHNRKNKSVITILSNIITETKESQTEYLERSRIFSETLLTSHIFEAEKTDIDIKRTENKQRVPPTINTSKVGPKQKEENQQNSTKPQPQKKTPNSKPQQNKKQTTQPKAHIGEMSQGNKKETKTTTRNKIDTAGEPHEIKDEKLFKNSKASENNQKNEKEKMKKTTQAKSNVELLAENEKEAKIVESNRNLEKNEIQQGGVTETKYHVKERKLKENEFQMMIQSKTIANKENVENGRNLIFQCKSYTYGKSEENGKKIIFQRRSEIRKEYHEIEKANLIHINQLLKENGKETRTINPSLCEQNENEHKTHEQLDNSKETECSLNAKNSPMSSCETDEKIQSHSASGNISSQIKRNNEESDLKKIKNSQKPTGTQLIEAKRKLINFILRKRHMKNSQ